MHITYVPITKAEAVPLTEEAAGKGVRKALGFVIMFAAPFVAAPLAAALGASSGIAAIMARTAVGAALGAGGSALAGGNPLIGAVAGGVGSLISPLGAGSAAAVPTAAGASGGVASTGAAAAPSLGASVGAATVPTVGPSLGATSATTASAAAQSAVATSLVQGASTMPTSVLDALRQAGSAVFQRFTTREGQAMLLNMVLQGNAPKELDGARRAYEAELERLGGLNNQRVAAMMRQAQEIAQLADRADPSQRALQRSVDAGILMNEQSEEAKRTAAGRGYSQDRRMAIQRKAGLRTAEEKSHAYATGYKEGEDQQATLRGLAISGYGSAVPSSAFAAAQYDTAKDRYNQRQEEIGNTLGWWGATDPNPAHNPERDDEWS